MARRILLTIAVSAALVYVLAVAYMASQETRLVFAAGNPLAQSRPASPFEQVDLVRPDGLRQFAWILRSPAGADSAPWLLYLHGNRATVASRVNILRYEQFRALGLHVFAPEYRGYGGLDGSPSEASVTQDARHAYAHLRTSLGVPPERIIIFGWSLGAAIAVNLASEVDEAAVILEGAPASLVAIGERNYPWLPVRLIMRNTFESILKVPRVGSPMLFLHSPDDQVIPIDEARRLFAAAREPKQFVEVAGGHTAPADADGERYFGAVASFLAAHGLLPAAAVSRHRE
ncbi:MAG TPA: alpha/beta fold hydrolase [Vicinamibacterales bacterium]|nr:alpha/beta fold hydrolase [Vicinamibacterales bacterium]